MIYIRDRFVLQQVWGRFLLIALSISRENPFHYVLRTPAVNIVLHFSLPELTKFVYDLNFQIGVH